MPSPHRTAYGNVAPVYDAFLAATGFKRGVENFLNRVAFDLPPRARILDAGCGTGLLAVYFCRRFPDAEIYATDLDVEMLREMERVIAREGLDRKRFVIGVGDLRTPDRFEDQGSTQPLVLPERHFDAIAVGGALEHVPLEESVARLARLLKPGGTFLNVGLRRSPAGAILGMMYRCRPYTLAAMRSACARAGLTDIHVLRLSVEDFPANLSRIAVMAKKLENKI